MSREHLLAPCPPAGEESVDGDADEPYVFNLLLTSYWTHLPVSLFTLANSPPVYLLLDTFAR